MPISEEEGVLTVRERTVGWMLRGPADGRVVGWFHGQPGSRRDVMSIADETLLRYGVRMLAVDRGGYGDTSPAGLDRRDVSRDLLTVADHLGVGAFPVMAMSMGGVYALTLAAMAPERIERVVLVSAHVLPYDDPAVVAALSPAEQADVTHLLAGRTPSLEDEYAAGAAAVVRDPEGVIRSLASGWGRYDQVVAELPAWRDAVSASVTFGLSPGHVGFLEDGLRTTRPLELDFSAIRCPVRAIHGTVDDLEPYANLERLEARLEDCQVFALPGMGHFAPWLWPDAVFGLLTGG